MYHNNITKYQGFIIMVIRNIILIQIIVIAEKSLLLNILKINEKANKTNGNTRICG